MMRYFITLNATIIGIERPIFPINTKGYIIGCMIYVKILPELTNGIEVVGFLNSFPPTPEGEPELHWMMLNINDGVIMGITENFHTSFGMPSQYTYGFASTSNQMTLDTICPELMKLKGTEKIKDPQGNIVSFDTTIIQNNYFLADEEEESGIANIEENEIDKFKYSVGGNHMYRCATVKATYYANFDYGDIDLYIVNFIEVDEEGEPILVHHTGQAAKEGASQADGASLSKDPKDLSMVISSDKKNINAAKKGDAETLEKEGEQAMTMKE